MSPTPQVRRRWSLRPIILAAGGGARLGGPKALAPIGQRTFLECIVATLESAGLRSPLVIIGADATRVRAHHTALDVEWCENRAWATTDMLTSCRLGLERLPSGHGALVWPVDGPHDDVELLQALADTVASDPTMVTRAVAAIPTFDGQPGHPVALSAGSVRALTATHHRSLRAFLTQPTTTLVSIGTLHHGVLRNINHPGDLGALDDPSDPTTAPDLAPHRPLP